MPAPLVGRTGTPASPDPSSPRGPSIDHGADARRALVAICPYLVAEDGGWRAAEPRREHRCTAVRPPAPLSDETQRRLCLVEAHVSCPDYLAARQRRAAELAKDRIGLEQLDSLRFQPAARAAPMVLAGPRTGARRGAGLLTSDPGSVLRTVRLPVVAGVLIVAAIFGSVFLGGLAPAPSASPSTRASSPALAGATATTTQGVGSPSAGTGPSGSLGVGSPSPSASIRTITYRIRRGDSLTRIARRFNTTVTVLKALNGLQDPPRIRIGQTLTVPAPAE